MFNLKLCHDVIYFAYKITVFSFYLLVRKLVAISNMINHNMYEPRHDEYVLNRGLSVTVLKNLDNIALFIILTSPLRHSYRLGTRL